MHKVFLKELLSGDSAAVAARSGSKHNHCHSPLSAESTDTERVRSLSEAVKLAENTTSSNVIHRVFKMNKIIIEFCKRGFVEKYHVSEREPRSTQT